VIVRLPALAFVSAPVPSGPVCSAVAKVVFSPIVLLIFSVSAKPSPS
jgi:hypothetical protein